MKVYKPISDQPVFLCDVDGVVAKLDETWFARYNRDYDDNLTDDKVTGWGMDEFVKPECGSKIYDYLQDPTLYDNCPPMQDALWGINQLRDMGYRVVFVTSSTAGHSGRKYRWLIDNGFLNSHHASIRDYVEAADKSVVAGDFIVDDGIHNLDTSPARPIMFLRPWNKKDTDKYPYVENWGELVQSIQEGKFLHVTERTRPIQVSSFWELIHKMYWVHLEKNADYSSANILGTGQTGVITRLWDKVARLLNLNGVDLDIPYTEQNYGLILLTKIYDTWKSMALRSGFLIRLRATTLLTAKNAKNESIDDTYIDLSVYGIIGYLYRKGLWGK